MEYPKPLPIIDVEKFILKVKAKPGLWDQNDPNYFKRDYLRVAWTKVSEETGVPVHELKKRWRGLRDTFGRELRKASALHPPEQLARGSNWRYFPLLLFLRDFVTSSKPPGDTADRLLTPRKRRKLTTSSRHDEFVAGEAPEEEEGSDPSMSDCPSSPASDAPDARTVHVKVEGGEEAHEAAEAAGWRAHESAALHLQEAAADAEADAQFLQSLLPFLRDVPRRRKLLVRARLAQVLQDEQDAAH